jgi:N-acetylmuramoyl-L-alanine amidase
VGWFVVDGVKQRDWPKRLGDWVPVFVVVVSLLVVLLAGPAGFGAGFTAQKVDTITLRGISSARIGSSPSYARGVAECKVVETGIDGVSTIVSGEKVRLVAIRSERFITASGARVSMTSAQIIAKYGTKLTPTTRGLLFTPTSTAPAEASLRLEFEISNETVSVIRVGEVSFLQGCPTTDATPDVATTPSTAASPGLNRVIVLDPGHNGANGRNVSKINRLVDAGGFKKACNTVGASGAGGLTEADFNWSVAQRTKRALEAQGWTVELTRPTNDGWGPCVNERGAKPGEVGAALMVSIHADGGPSSGRGFHVIYPATKRARSSAVAQQSKDLAVIVRDALVGSGMQPSTYVGRGGLSERNDLGTVNLSTVPAVIIESGNLANAADEALLASVEFQDRLAAAIVASVSAWSKA